MSRIPKVLHHVWMSNNPFKEKFHGFRCSWMRYNPDWNFLFHTIDNMRYDGLPKKCIEGIKHPVLHYTAKSDIARWCILWLYGGVYVDTDVECLANFDEFMDNEMFAGISYEPNGIGNAVVGAVPKHRLSYAIMMAITEACLKDVRATNKNIVDMTVNLSGKMLAKCPKIYPRDYFYPIKWDLTERTEKFITNPKEMFPKSYTIHHWSGVLKDGWTWDTIKTRPMTAVSSVVPVATVASLVQLQPQQTVITQPRTPKPLSQRVSPKELIHA